MPAAEFGGTVYTSMFAFTASVDPASLNAESAADTTVSSMLVKAGDIVIPIAPATLEGRFAVLGCHTVADGSFKLRLGNSGDDAVDGAALTWTFLVVRR